MTQLTPLLPHLLTTLSHRPYVFIFLFFFLVFGTLQLGILRTLCFLFLGWVIAFASEVSSIRNGFPYGDYKYIYENLKGEFLLWGVPLWDSLSYTFLAYASFSTAVLISLSYPPRTGSSRCRAQILLLSVLFMTGIDVIIDPLTALGDRWFLGRIYYYPNGGFYFGVPLTNFIGWALVAFTIVFLFQGMDRFLEKRGRSIPLKSWTGLKAWLGVALYLGVFFFNGSITLWLKEWKLAAMDLVLLFPLLFFLRKAFGFQRTLSKENCAPGI